MKLKEAIETLQAYLTVAGDAAEFEAESIVMHSGLHIEYERYYGGEQREKSRKVTYSVGVEKPAATAERHREVLQRMAEGYGVVNDYQQWARDALAGKDFS